jgi:EAL domain-containing protein (putative c-di-GMP-specific phosphodiesterase class I)
LIIPLGRWVLEVACAEPAAWAIPLRLAVNLSPAQFRDEDLPEFIGNVLEKTGLAGNRLDLEVTEGLLLEDVEGVIRTMQSLRGMGIRIVLDDFGTAQSNLSYLRGFPFDAVKIDRSFLRALNSDRQARALVEAMLAMARALGLDVVGEGIETREQLALLTHLRCRWVQGYLLDRPAPNKETRDWIWKLAAKSAATDKARLPATAARA